MQPLATIREVEPEDELQRRFGLALAALRKDRGLSQQRLADGALLSRTYLSELELGLKSPSLRSIARLARVLEVSSSTLIERAESG
jgi:transcriptional regulator with XRE-family HTH domain